jgi:hypothetical protein
MRGRIQAWRAIQATASSRKTKASFIDRESRAAAGRFIQPTSDRAPARYAGSICQGVRDPGYLVAATLEPPTAVAVYQG